MKKVAFILGVVVLTSCNSFGRFMSGVSEFSLLKTVSVEKGCPLESVKIIDKVQTAGNATYRVNACGKEFVYKQVGSVFLEASEANKLLLEKK
ncbi:hypothetical protein ACT4R9_00055 [Ornithobacterium rhinotracheale]|uniref:hypothetical protein n=1 Tax=Ornithobacterium rhinotracheale TaxID=28251 RepID=UPI003FA47EE5